MASLARRRLVRWLVGAGVAAIAVALLTGLPVETRQGVDYVVHTRRIPLVLKAADFYTRHLQYKTLVREIVGGAEGEEAQVLAVFRWVHEHIHAGTPSGLRVIDDHPWNIVVRGYGEADQLADVFVTLSSYLGVPGYFYAVRAPSHDATHVFSVVSVGGRERLFDPYFGVVFRNRAGDLATPDEVRRDPAVLERLQLPRIEAGLPYAAFIGSDQVVFRSARGRYQSPWTRLAYAFGW